MIPPSGVRRILNNARPPRPRARPTLPPAGTSNSVLHHGVGQSWHGYVERNVWTAC